MLNIKNYRPQIQLRHFAKKSVRNPAKRNEKFKLNNAVKNSKTEKMEKYAKEMETL